jgi:hypothetical protein
MTRVTIQSRFIHRTSNKCVCKHACIASMERQRALVQGKTSLSRSPLAWVDFCRSLPARSTRLRHECRCFVMPSAVTNVLSTCHPCSEAEPSRCLGSEMIHRERNLECEERVRPRGLLVHRGLAYVPATRIYSQSADWKRQRGQNMPTFICRYSVTGILGELEELLTLNRKRFKRPFIFIL